MIFHVITRRVARQTIFPKDQDYAAFERVLHEAHQNVPVRILAFCLMPNHWHFVLWPTTDDQVAEFTKWMTHTHTQRYHAHYHTSGAGHLYQGRYKGFRVQPDRHALLVRRPRRTLAMVQPVARRGLVATEREDRFEGSIVSFRMPKQEPPPTPFPPTKSMPGTPG
jgi:putative transposase